MHSDYYRETDSIPIEEDIFILFYISELEYAVWELHQKIEAEEKKDGGFYES
jgi:hypothetical protein